MICPTGPEYPPHPTDWRVSYHYKLIATGIRPYWSFPGPRKLSPHMRLKMRILVQQGQRRSRR